MSSYLDNILIHKILSELNIPPEEAKIYLYLFENGPHTVGLLSKKTRLKRSSLYGVLKRLIIAGFVNESIKENVKLFSAEPPEKIELIIQERIEHLRKQKDLFKEALPDLLNKQMAKFIQPKLQLYEGSDGVQHVLKDLLLYSNMETQAFWPIQDMLNTLTPDFFRYFNKERVRSNLFTRAIWPHNKIISLEDHPYLGTGLTFKREVRIAPEHISFSMGYWIYGYKTAFLSSSREGFAFIIESTELAQLLKTQFEVIWKISKPLQENDAVTAVFIKELDGRL